MGIRRSALKEPDAREVVEVVVLSQPAEPPTHNRIRSDRATPRVRGRPTYAQLSLRSPYPTYSSLIHHNPDLEQVELAGMGEAVAFPCIGDSRDDHEVPRHAQAANERMVDGHDVVKHPHLVRMLGH